MSLISSPLTPDKAISIDVPAVLLVLMKMNLYLWEIIMAADVGGY
jgi:hypothetical protein